MISTVAPSYAASCGGVAGVSAGAGLVAVAVAFPLPSPPRHPTPNHRNTRPLLVSNTRSATIVPALARTCTRKTPRPHQQRRVLMDGSRSSKAFEACADAPCCAAASAAASPSAAASEPHRTPAGQNPFCLEMWPKSPMSLYGAGASTSSRAPRNPPYGLGILGERRTAPLRRVPPFAAA